VFIKSIVCENGENESDAVDTDSYVINVSLVVALYYSQHYCKTKLHKTAYHLQKVSLPLFSHM
jgi:hypothetical protein